MHGLSLLLLSGRERTAGLITAIIFFVAAAASPQPRRTIVDGQEIVEPVLFGRVFPMWVLFVVAVVLIGATHTLIHRLLLRFWPEPEEAVSADEVYLRPDGGLVAWSGDDPEAGSPFDYRSPSLRTALDYLQAEGPAPIRVLILGEEEAMEEDRAFHRELSRWLGEASESDLRDLIPAARQTGRPIEDVLAWRLTDAAYARRIPSLDDLADFAEETGSDDLREYVSVRRSENGDGKEA